MCRNKSIAAFWAISRMLSELILTEVVQSISRVEPILIDKNKVSSLSSEAETSMENAGSTVASAVSEMRKIWY